MNTPLPETVAVATNQPSSGEKLARTLELTHLAIAGIAIVVTHLVAGFGDTVNGVVAGAVIGALNLRAMIWLTRKLLAAGVGTRGRYAILFAVKLAILGSVVWLVLSRMPVDSLGFIIGFSSLLPSALWVAFLRSLEVRTSPAPATAARSGQVPGKSRYSTHQEQRS
jgi:hypothetical protein